MKTIEEKNDEKTKAVLDYWRETDYPTVRSCQQALNLSSTSVVVYQLNKLVDLGRLTHYPNTAHAYRIVKEDKE